MKNNDTAFFPLGHTYEIKLNCTAHFLNHIYKRLKLNFCYLSDQCIPTPWSHISEIKNNIRERTYKVKFEYFLVDFLSEVGHSWLLMVKYLLMGHLINTEQLMNLTWSIYHNTIVKTTTLRDTKKCNAESISQANDHLVDSRVHQYLQYKVN